MLQTRQEMYTSRRHRGLTSASVSVWCDAGLCHKGQGPVGHYNYQACSRSDTCYHTRELASCMLSCEHLTVDARGAAAWLTIKIRLETASDDMSSPSASSKCVASSRSFAVKRRLFTSLRKIEGSRFIRCNVLAAYMHSKSQSDQRSNS